MSTRAHRQATPRRSVLWVSKGLGPGGAERLLVTLAGELRGSGLEISAAYLLPHKDHLVEALEERGVAARCIGGRPWDPRWLVRLRRRMRLVDVVHVHSPVVAIASRVLALSIPARHRPCLVVTEHNSWASHRPPTRWANRLTVGLEDALVAVSDEVLSSMSARAQRRAQVVIHGVPLEEVRRARGAREQVRAELELGDAQPLIVTVANLRGTKDHPGLLRAARRVLDERPDARFVVAGQGPLEADLRAQRDALGLGRSFCYLGYVEDVPRLLAAADLFVLSSRHEGLPIALMEALALGVPPVSTDVGGIASMVRPGVDGLLVRAGDPSALASAILELVNDPVRRGEISNRLGSRSDLGIGPAVRAHREIYRRCATIRGSGP